jgi:hypothetical protein
MMADQSNTPMDRVVYRTASGGSGIIQTVERAIDYIDKDLDQSLAGSDFFAHAKEVLHEALVGKRSVADARFLLFMAALNGAKLLII